jgi:hypothetical protein
VQQRMILPDHQISEPTPTLINAISVQAVTASGYWPMLFAQATASWTG